jgi:hypothetical protein
MTEDIRDDIRNDISKTRDLRGEPDAELSTADLAVTSQARPRTIDVEPLLNGESPQPLDGPSGAPLTTDISRSDVRGAATARALEQETGPLFSSNEANELRGRWDTVQVGFVDEPRRAVEQADNLVAGTMKRLAEIFADERNKLEGRWDQGQNVSTEDLRLALRRYRSFFSRLLSV